MRARDIGIFAAGLIIAAGGLSAAALIGAGDAGQAQDQDKLARDWTNSIQKLGIRPVFPPSEEFYVGDVYAADFSNAQTHLLFESIKLAHIEGTQALLESAYKDLPSFPPTPVQYEQSSIIESTGGIFDPPAVRRSLPIMAFFNFVVATAKAQTAGLGIVTGLRSLFGFSRGASETVKIKIPEAETYGITAEQARDMLNKFCKRGTNNPNPVCTQTIVRQLLSSVVGPSALCLNDLARPTQKPQETGARSRHSWGYRPIRAPELPNNPDDVAISLVYRVYLTRSIDYEYGSDTSVAAAARVGQDDAAASSRASDGSASPAARPSGERDKLAGAVDVAQRQIAGLKQGGLLTVSGVTANGVELKRILARPVVIGYTPLWQMPIDDGCIVTPLKPGSQTN